MAKHAPIIIDDNGFFERIALMTDAGLRFVKKPDGRMILQQYWSGTKYNVSRPAVAVAEIDEWRDVPVAESE